MSKQSSASTKIRKKVDSRIRTLIENCVHTRHRSFFVLVGDDSRSQIVNLHYMLTKARVQSRPNILWCYKKDLGFKGDNRARTKRLTKKQKDMNKKKGGNDEEEDEVDEPLALSVPTSTEIVTANSLQNCSTECSEALTAIASDCWDISSWIIYYEEVQQGRAGNITVVEAHERIIAQFPRSARFWKNLAEYHLHRGENDTAEETFRKCLSKCRSIDLWKSYLSYLYNAFIDTMRLNMPLEQHSKVRAKCESAFEEAVENVGLALGSFPLWRSYIDFVKSWPEAGMIESGKKLHMLRHVYQRAVGVAMEQSDEIWTEYETFEKSNGEQSAELVLPEFNRKYLHAKSVAKDRRKLTQSIVFDRLATPPTNSQSELQQLEYWSLWIR